MNIGIEDERTEFKETLAEKDEAMKDICAILNKTGRGLLYFGVKNSGDVKGFPVGQKTQTTIADKIASSLSPAPQYAIRKLLSDDGSPFIEVSFQGNARPYFCKGVAFIRHADKSDIMPPELLQQMILQGIRHYSEWEASPSDCALDEIDEKLLRQVYATGNEKNRINHPYTDLLDGLRHFRLLTPDGRVNKAGEFLFGKNGAHSIRLATLSGVSKDAYLDMGRAYGNAFELIEEAYLYLLKHLDHAPKKNERGIERDTELEIPPAAIRELVVNAFDHADYSLSMEQEFDVFANRISIYSPGVFPAFVTPEQFALKEKDPINKNGRIAKVLFIAGVIENFGTGFETAFSLFRQKRISYSYQSRQGGFLFEVYRKGREKVEEGLASYPALISLIRQNNYLGAEGYAVILGVSRATVFRMLSRLESDGKIIRIKEGKSSYYRVADSAFI